MAWRHAAGGSLALLLLTQGVAMADSASTIGADQEAVAAPEPSEEEAPLPWAELRSEDPKQPLLGGEYNRIMAALWATLEENWAVRSHHITTACSAMGSDMAYLRGRLPRQIEDAYRQMAPFQTKALFETSPVPAQRPFTALSFGILFIDDTEPDALLELIRAGDSFTYDTYQQLLWHFVDLDLAAYIDPAQDDVPLSRAEFLAYVETLHRQFQDPMGDLGQHEQFLREADQLINDLLTMLREVRQSLALLEATKSNLAAVGWALPTTGGGLSQKVPRAAIAPHPPQAVAQLIPLPAIAIEDNTPVTRRDFLLAMMGLIASLDSSFHYTPRCGGYRVDSFLGPDQALQGEIWHLMQALDSLNLEILTLVRDRAR
jgi:hypothetical protein